MGVISRAVDSVAKDGVVVHMEKLLAQLGGTTS